MGRRHESIGIKQIIRFEWMQKTTNLLMAGLNAKAIRQELHELLSGRNENGLDGERSDNTRTFLVNNLMNIWVTPDAELIPFRDALLAFLSENINMALAVHWSMISAVYPFWFNVALQTGRLLTLQGQVTRLQIINRLKEQYGDRQTVSRYARYVIRSFVDWGVLEDSIEKGCYMKTVPLNIIDSELLVLILESALLAVPTGKGTFEVLLNNPSFFPFLLPVMNGEYVCQRSKRIEVFRYGLDDELLKLHTR